MTALRQHLHLKLAELETQLALSEATMWLRSHQIPAPLDLVASEHLLLLMEVLSLAFGVFVDPASTES